MAAKFKFWLVGMNTNYEAGAWEFGGIYTTEQEAYDRCEDGNWWIALITLDEIMYPGITEFETAYYPKLYDDE